MKTMFLLLLGLLIADTGFAQFYMGCDALIAEKPYGYRPASTISAGNMEFYQDSARNRFLLVSNLDKQKIVHPFYYQVLKDPITGEDYLLLKRVKTLEVKSGNKQPINELTAYRNFVKIDPVSRSDSAFLARSEYINDGIDRLEGLWHIAAKAIPCDLYIDLKRNNPRHSDSSYYYLDFVAPCLSVRSQSPYKDDN